MTYVEPRCIIVTPEAKDQLSMNKASLRRKLTNAVCIVVARNIMTRSTSADDNYLLSLMFTRANEL